MEIRESNQGLTLNTLKYIAVVAMVLDHVAYVFVPSDQWLYIWMRFFGRITAPIMFYAAVEGYHHTSSISKYLTRLGILAAICYLPFIFTFAETTYLEGRDFLQLNVIYTIFMGVLGVHFRRKIEDPVVRVSVIAALGILCLYSDWGVLGYTIILLFDYFYGDFKNQAIGYCLIVFFSIDVITDFTQLVSILETFDAGIMRSIVDFLYYEMLGYGKFLPIILLSYYNGERGSTNSFSKWFFYIFYPAHLVIIWLVDRYISG